MEELAEQCLLALILQILHVHLFGPLAFGGHNGTSNTVLPALFSGRILGGVCMSTWGIIEFVLPPKSVPQLLKPICLLSIPKNNRLLEILMVMGRQIYFGQRHQEGQKSS